MNVESIKSHVDMLDVLGRYSISLDRRGFACCPFHREKTPSFKVFNNNQNYKCFGCGESGDVIEFVKKIENVDFVEACKRLDLMFGLNLFDCTFLQYREANRAEQKRRKEAEEHRARQAYHDKQYDLLRRYFHWLRKQEPTEAIKNDLRYVGDLLDKYMNGENLIDWPANARISALFSKHRKDNTSGG